MGQANLELPVPHATRIEHVVPAVYLAQPGQEWGQVHTGPAHQHCIVGCRYLGHHAGRARVAIAVRPTNIASPPPDLED